MRRALTVVACSSLVLGGQTALGQQKIPVVELSAASAKTSETLGAVLGIRQLPGGKVLVNDAGRRQIRLFDSSLTHSSVIIDSTAGVANSYGPFPAPLMAYLGDSSLWVDYASQSFVVLDPKGQVARTMAAPRTGDLRTLSGSASGIDNKGRLLYKGGLTVTQNQRGGTGFRVAPGAMPSGTPGAMGSVQPPDSAPLLRADFDSRAVDTVGRLKQQNGGRISVAPDDKGVMKVKVTVNPLSTIDEWAVLTDGSIALVRGHDYHIDWIHPDGSKSSSPKLPFDWKRLTDEDKQALIDSARKAQANNAQASVGGGRGDAAGAAAAVGGEGTTMSIVMRGGAGSGGSMGGAVGQQTMMPQTMKPEIDYVPIKEIGDYYPAIRLGAAKADLDGNLWILPTTSAQSKNGELVYDVVNNKGELFERVRVPVGRSVAGFGRGGIVYLTSGDRTNGFYLERARLIGGMKGTE